MDAMGSDEASMNEGDCLIGVERWEATCE